MTDQLPEVVESVESTGLPPEIAYAQKIERESQQQQQELPGDQQQEEIKVEKKVHDYSYESNIRVLREAKERAEWERDEMMRKMRDIEQRFTAPQRSLEPEEDDIKIAPDEIAEGKHLTQMEKKVKKLEGLLRNYQQQSEESIVEAKLKSQFPDFDQVVSASTIEIMKQKDPSLARTLSQSTNIYDKAVVAYNWIKNNVDTSSNYQVDKERALKNISKPKPSATISPQQGDSPLSKANAFANGLTPDLQNQLYKEMMQYRNNI